jgi:thiol-disulfide isomerase/thioredoxin
MKTLLYPLLVLVLGACDAAPGGTQLGDLSGRWAVVNYWAEWCTPCIAEIPELNALATAYPDLAVAGVNFDGATGDELAQQLAKLGVAFPTLAQDPSPALGIARPAVLPTTLIIDPQGRLVETLIGPQTLDSLTEAIERRRSAGTAQ